MFVSLFRRISLFAFIVFVLFFLSLLRDFASDQVSVNATICVVRGYIYPLLMKYLFRRDCIGLMTAIS